MSNTGWRARIVEAAKDVAGDVLKDAGDALEDAPEAWQSALAAALGPLIFVAVLARSVSTLGLLPGGLAGPVTSAVVLIVMCLALLGLFIVAANRSVSGQHRGAWQVVYRASVFISLGLFVETFAVITTCIWRASGVEVTAWSGLWRAESFYLWHLARSIPLLDIPGSLGWPTPAYGADHTPPGVVLAFKFVVIAPLLWAALGLYRLIVERSTDRASSKRLDEFGNVRGPLVAAAALIGAAALGLAASWIFLQVFDAGSWLNQWWPHALHAMHADGPRIVQWTLAVPAVVLIAVFCFALLLPAGMLTETLEGLALVRSWWIGATMLVGGLAALYGAMLWVAGLLLELGRLHLKVDVPETVGLWQLVESVGWHIVHALPGPDITGTLGWTAPVTLTGAIAGLVLLVLKLYVAVLLVFVVVPVVRTATNRTRYGPLLDLWNSAIDAAYALRTKPELSTRSAWDSEDWHLRERGSRSSDELAKSAQRVLQQGRFKSVHLATQSLVGTFLANGHGDDVADEPDWRRITEVLELYRERVFENFPACARMLERMPDWFSEIRQAGPGAALGENGGVLSKLQV